MPNKKMSVDERYTYFEIQFERYQQAKKSERSQLLDEMMAVTGMRRKSLTRLMAQAPRRRVRGQQRSKKYGAEVQDLVRGIARAMDYPCRERLTPMLPGMADQMAVSARLRFSQAARDQLETVSTSTVERILKRIQQDQPRLRRRAAGARVNQIQRQVPIQMIPWDEQEPGHFEVDLVYHSGPSSSGEFVCSLQMVDVATSWSEMVAILGRSYIVTRDAFRRCLARMPFQVKQIHSDNGSEFLNSHLLTFWKEQPEKVILTRTRPYHSQDNRFIEHRNGALIRAMIGHDRFDTVRHTDQLNHVYQDIWLYFNFFQPVMRLTQKFDAQGRPQRKYENVRTPFQRLSDSQVMTKAEHARLQALFEQTNPLALREKIDQGLGTLFRLSNAEPGHTEDIYQTLAFPEDL